MTKTCKKILLTVFLALCFVLCFGALVACGDDETNPNNPSNPNSADDDAVTYAVTVLKDDETPASGVKVSIRKGSSRFPGKNTDADGKVEFELSPDSYTVELDQDTIPEHYSVPDNANLSLTKDSRSLTVTLAKKFVYTVNLVDTDGNPYYAEGVTVGVCTFAGTCKNPVALPSNGVAVIEEVAGDYHVKVEGLPTTAAIPCDSDNYYTGKDFSETETEMTITVYPVTDVTALTPMTDAEKTAYAASDKNISYYTKSDLTAYHVTKALAAGETAYFSFTPEVGGTYNVYKSNSDSEASYLFNKTAFQLGNVGNNAIYYAFPETLKAGTTYRFNVTNLTDAAINAEFVVESPAASYTQISGQFASAITTTVTIAKENTNAIIELSPTAGVALKLTAQGTTKASIQCHSSSYYAENAMHTDYEAEAECTAKFTQDQVGLSLYISVAVDEVANYPVELKIKIERTKVLTNTTNTVSVTETLTTYEKPEGDYALKSANVADESDLEKNAEDGYYYVDGKLVLVKVKDLAYLDQTNFRFTYVLDVTSEADKADLTKGKTFSDYRLFIRGFKDYDESVGGVGGMETIREIPKNIATATYYAKSANTDGAYPLTEELLTFIKALYANNENYLSGSWTNALYCYKEVTLSEDPIVNNYKDAEGATLVVNADGSFTITEYGSPTNGEWEKNEDGTYTFVTADEYEYTVTRDELGILSFEFYESVAYTFKTDEVVGNYISGDKTLAVKGDGTYTLTEPLNPNPINGTWEKNNNGTYTFTDDDTEWGNTYTVTRNSAGTLAFVDENDVTERFKVYADPILNKFLANVVGDDDETVTITLKVDESDFEFISDSSYESGTWEKTSSGYSFYTLVYADMDDFVGTKTLYATAQFSFGNVLVFTLAGDEATAYNFRAYVDPAINSYTTQSGVTLTVEDDGTFVLVDDGVTTNGKWFNYDDSYSFIYTVIENDEEVTKFYTVTLDEDTNALTFANSYYDDEEGFVSETVYEFTVNEE